MTLREGWDTRPLGECLAIPAGYGANAPSIDYSPSLPRYLRITDIGDEGQIIDENKRSISPEDANGCFLEDGDVVFARTGATVGKTYLHRKSRDPIAFAGYLIRFRVDRELLNPDFLFQYCQSPAYWAWVALMSRAGAQPNINAGEYSSLRLPLPPVTEQNAIVAVLSAWDRGIRQLSDLIAAKLRFKQGLMQQLLTGKRRFKEFRGNLVSASLGDIVDFVNGRAFKPSEWKSAGLPIIRIQNLNGSTEYNHFDGLYDDKHLVRPGDLLFSWSGSRGTSFGSFFWHGPEGLLNQHIFRVLPRSTVGKRYIGHVLRYVTGIIETKAHGSAGLVHVTKRELEKFHIDFSDNLDEQDRVATVLDNADHEIDLLRKELDALKTQKKGLMQKLLTGQVRVKLPKGGA